MTGTAAHVTAVVEIDRRPVGNGKTGAVTPNCKSCTSTSFAARTANTPTGARPPSDIMEYQPQRTTGAALGALATAWALLFAALLVLRGANHPVSLSTVFCYLFAALFLGIASLAAYWTYCLLAPALQPRPQRPRDPLGLRPAGRPPRQRKAARPRRSASR